METDRPLSLPRQACAVLIVAAMLTGLVWVQEEEPPLGQVLAVCGGFLLAVVALVLLARQPHDRGATQPHSGSPRQRRAWKDVPEAQRARGLAVIGCAGLLVAANTLLLAGGVASDGWPSAGALLFPLAMIVVPVAVAGGLWWWLLHPTPLTVDRERRSVELGTWRRAGVYVLLLPGLALAHAVYDAVGTVPQSLAAAFAVNAVVAGACTVLGARLGRRPAPEQPLV